jgi:hypothetical protein
MRVLVACECSGKVRDAFISLGHDAMSCDLQATEVPGPHYQGSVFDVMYACWDLIIVHPPCTHLAVSGAKHFEKKKIDGRQAAAISFFMQMANAPAPMLCVENPVGIMSTLYRTPDQIVQPWQFGEEFQKTTCLWLKGLPLLAHTKVVGKGEFVTTPSGKRLPKWYSDNKSSKVRSRTFEGIAKAMAEQWGGTSCAEELGQKNYAKEIQNTASNTASTPDLQMHLDLVL